MAYAFAEVMGREKTSPVEVPKRLDKFLQCQRFRHRVIFKTGVSRVTGRRVVAR